MCTSSAMNQMSHRTSTLTETTCRQNSGCSPLLSHGNFGFPAHELRRIRTLIEEYQTRFLEVWNGHIGTQR